MPTKKNAAPNGFFYFMQSLKPELKRQGVRVESNRELAELAGPKWSQLSAEERAPFNELAKQEKQNRRYGPTNNVSKMDCTGQLISKRVDTVQLNEQKRRKERKQVVESWTGKDICEEHFFMIAFMSLCNMPDDQYMPCEMAVAEYSLRQGIIRTLHKFIDPGAIPVGYRFAAMQQSETTHGIPPEGLATESYFHIYEQLLQFVNPKRLHSFPPVFCKSSETKLTEFSLDWLASRAGCSNKLKKVYELENLVCDLYAESKEAEVKMCPSKRQATQLLSTTAFDYEPGSRCKWHEEKEIRFCACGTVKRYCYCLSDFLCGAFGIDVTSNHLPERPEGEPPCIVITPKVETSSSKQRKEETDYLEYRTVNSYESGVRKKQYARRGPTYDTDSLKSSSIDSPASSSNAVPGGFLGFPRGRGRGCVVSTQPLRRPNLPGIAGRGEEQAKGETPPVSSESELESPWSGTLGAGRGVARGVRPPNTAPKVWAGSVSSPHPSAAPLPPSAWQHKAAASSTGSGAPPNAQSSSKSDHSNPTSCKKDASDNFEKKFETFSLFDRDSFDY